MSLSAGARLGSYEIIELIGVGGMGEVYRAHDAKLRRDVALKILPTLFTADAERRARLVREAHILASLNHPSIAGIYDLVEEQHALALVLELVEGPTLAERIAAGPLTVETSLSIALQIADALDVAHDKGVVHRDLKPANIKLAADDRVKVLDFGLAKAFAADSQIDVTSSPTITSMTSRAGVILGTASYMSPEQAKGKTTDKRVDIWAFGCVLYEMLTGKQMFPGEDVTDIIVAVITKDPDWSLLPPHTPSRIVKLLQWCMQREPRERLRDIGDARADLKARQGDESSSADATSRLRTRSSVQFRRLTDFLGINDSPAISPDGKMVAFVAARDGRRHVWIRLLAGGLPLQVTRDDIDHEHPRWSPDSSSLIYYTPAVAAGGSGTIWEVSALGGPPRPLAQALGGGDVSHDGRRIATFQSVNGQVELAIISRDGSTVDYVRPLPATVSCGCPRWSPDDRAIAFHAELVPYFDQRIVIVSSSGGTHHDVVRGAILRGLTWLPDGSGLVYGSSVGSALPYPPTFNLRVVDRDGATDRQLTFGDASYVEPDVYGSTRLVASRIRARSDIWQFPVTGTPTENTRDARPVTRQAGRVQTPSLSPDGSEVVYLADSAGRGNLWVTRIDSGATRQITFNQDPRSAVGVPVWSPKGDRITFLMTREGEGRVWIVHPDGSGMHQLDFEGFYVCWSGDGQSLYYTPPRTRPLRIVKRPVAGDTVVEIRNDHAIAPAVAADDSALYYASTNPGTGRGDWEIRVARPPEGASHAIARIPAARIPLAASLIHMFLSPDGTSLALPLTDGISTNLWVLPTDGGEMKPVTDLAGRPTIISRRIAWGPDGRSLYAAVEEFDADVISLDGLLG